MVAKKESESGEDGVRVERAPLAARVYVAAICGIDER